MSDARTDASSDQAQAVDCPVPDYTELLTAPGTVALVVGAGQGIGRQAAHALAQSGAHVCCVDTDTTRAERIAEEVGGTPYVADATDEEQVVRLVEQVLTDHGRLDTVVDIVGMARFRSLADASNEDWQWQFAVVLDHVRHLIKHTADPLATHGGSITVVSSIAALSGAQGNGPYAAAKAAVVSLVRTAAVELAPRGVRVNTVAPDVVLTPRMEQILDPERRAAFVANSPLGRLAVPSDVAAAILFLSSRLASYVTGQVVVLDGGVGARLQYPDFV
ncbi:3-oxoacyl-[acyl-carrier protein] reductase [Actinomycetales bacterium JB111]|nr:3-oxoacyl-[acyl-carrier protein] reductase [Actinomycetales bacterium JB111]